MRIFVKHNGQGDILAVDKVDTMPDHLEQPFGTPGDNEYVLEVPVTDALQQLDAATIHDQYRVNVEQKEIFKPGEPS